MSKGRATPTKIKKIQGTLRKDRVNENEVEFTSIDYIPDPEPHWPENVIDLWYSLCNELISKGLLFLTDIASLRAYCFAIHQYREAEIALMDEGFVIEHTNTGRKTNKVVSPWLRVISDARQVIDSFGRKFGFSPLDKSKIAVSNGKKLQDPFTEI